MSVAVAKSTLQGETDDRTKPRSDERTVEPLAVFEMPEHRSNDDADNQTDLLDGPQGQRSDFPPWFVLLIACDGVSPLTDTPCSWTPMTEARFRVVSLSYD